MKVFCKRIKNIPFSIIHYLTLIVLIMFPIRAYTLLQYVELYHGDHHLMDAGMCALNVAAIMFFLAFALVTVRFIISKVKNRHLESVEKKEKTEKLIVNPELEREGSDSVSSGYLD